MDAGRPEGSTRFAVDGLAVMSMLVRSRAGSSRALRSWLTSTAPLLTSSSIDARKGEVAFGPARDEEQISHDPLAGIGGYELGFRTVLHVQRQGSGSDYFLAAAGLSPPGCEHGRQ